MKAPNKTTINGVHFGPIKQISFSPDHKYLLSLGSNDGIINVINIDNFDISTDFNTASITNDEVFAFSTNEKRDSFILTDDGNQILNVNWPDISQTSKISETEMALKVLAANSNGNLIAASGDDPQISIINLDDPEEDPDIKYDNTKTAVYIGFGPVCQTLVIINIEGEIFAYSSSSSYQDKIDVKNNIKTVFPGVCWSKDSQILISDSEKKGVFHAFHFPSEGYATGKISNLGFITALSISDSYLLAACDASQKVVISQYSADFIQNQQLPILQVFDPEIQQITFLFWINNNLVSGDAEGSIHKWDKIDNSNEIEVVPSVMESDNEIEEIESEDDVSTSRHIILSGKHQIDEPSRKKKPKEYSDESEEEDYDEETYKRSKNPYSIDEASEASSGYESENEYQKKSRSNAPSFTPKISADEFAERIKQKFNTTNEYSTTPSETETEGSDVDRPLSKEEVRARKAIDRREAKLDRQFIVNSGSEVSAAETESNDEEEDAIEKLTDDEEEELIESNQDKIIQFMPGSTDDFENKRRFLCFNLIAKIFLRENADESTSIDIEYNDRYKYKSTHFENKDMYTLATVTETGVTLASRIKVNYKPHKSWSTDYECSIKMEHDEYIDLVASGNDWFAVATNLKRLRIFMGSGLEIAIMSIPQRPMTMVGGDDFLVIVYGYQFNDDLNYSLIDVKKRKELANDLLPISKIVYWMGFDNRTFYVLGNNHILYALVNDFKYQFVPMCNVQPKDEGNSEFWGVGVKDDQFFGVFLKDNRKFPEPIPNQIMESIPIEPQCIDDESSDYIMKKIVYCNSSKKDKEKNAMKMDTELLKLLAKAADKRLYEKMLHIGLLITSKKCKKFTLDYIRQKDEDYQDIGNKLAEYWGSINQTEEEEEDAKEVEQTHEDEENDKEIEQNHEDEENDKEVEQTHEDEDQNVQEDEADNEHEPQEQNIEQETNSEPEEEQPNVNNNEENEQITEENIEQDSDKSINENEDDEAKEVHSEKEETDKSSDESDDADSIDDEDSIE